MASIDQSSDIEVSEDEIEKVSSPETLSIWGLAWPSILANILFAAVGIVGLKAVGALGTEALAAVGTGQRIFFVIQSLIMAVSTGTTALIARAYGSGNKNEGALVLFPSYLDHSVNENTSNQERIVVSFNITINMKLNKSI